MADLDDLVGRLRNITGYSDVGVKPGVEAVAPVVSQIDEDSVLVLRQSLRRHPSLLHIYLTAEEQEGRLYEELSTALVASSVGTGRGNRLLSWLQWVNRTARKLEVDRLGSLYADPEAVLHDHERKMQKRTGLDELPDLAQVTDGNACPWYPLFALLSCPLFIVEFDEHPRSHLSIPNATRPILDLQLQVEENYGDTLAWVQLLRQLMNFPIAVVRSVWEAALYLFPTAGSLVCCYVKLELRALAEKPRLEHCASEEDAKEIYVGYLRLLNTFWRHLPLAYSCELYELFFHFLGEYVHPDNGSLDALYRMCLRRDVGILPHSTELWMRYLIWRSSCFRDGTRRREWRKRMYRRILQIPLLGLDRIKEEFDIFIAGENRGRLPPDEKIEVEKRLVRVKAECTEIARLMFPFYPLPPEPAPGTSFGVGTVSASLQQPPRFPTHLYLSRPLPIDGATDPIHGRESVLACVEIDLWSNWEGLMSLVRRPLFPGAAGELLHYARCRNFLSMHACFFPHQVTVWMSLLDFCVNQQPMLSEKERFATVAAALSLTRQFQRKNPCIQIFLADLYLMHLASPTLAQRTLLDCLFQQRDFLVLRIKTEENRAGEKEALLESLQMLAVGAVNLMRMQSAASATDQMALVARVVMREVDFLSLTMGVLRKLLKANQIEHPSNFLRPFNTFCAEWIEMEVVRNKNTTVATLIAKQWAEHLKMMLRSALTKGWTCAQCGLDELFARSLTILLAVDFSATNEAVEPILAAVEAAALEAGLDGDDFIKICQRIRHRFYLPVREEKGLACALDDVRLSSAFTEPLSAPHRVDTLQFSSTIDPRWSLSLPIVKDYTTVVPRKEVPDTASAGASRRIPKSTLVTPMVSMWGGAGGGGGSFSGRFPPPRRRRPLSEAEQHMVDSLPKVPNAPAFPLAMMTEVHHLPDIRECLAVGLEGSVDDPTAEVKLPPLAAVEDLIRALPTLAQYDPEVEEMPNIVTEWLLDVLLSGEALYPFHGAEDEEEEEVVAEEEEDYYEGGDWAEKGDGPYEEGAEEEDWGEENGNDGDYDEEEVEPLSQEDY